MLSSGAGLQAATFCRLGWQGDDECSLYYAALGSFLIFGLSVVPLLHLAPFSRCRFHPLTSMPTVEPEQLAIREMREDEAPIVLDLLKDGFKDTENRLILYVLTRPLALLLMAVVSSGLRFFLNSFVVALALPVVLTVVALKLLLWRSPDLKHLYAYYGVGQRGIWVAVYDEDDVCGCVALEPRSGESHTAELKRLAVNRWYRRSGVGRHLLSFLENQAREEGFAFLVARVSVVTRAAIGLFESAGYKASSGSQWLGYTIQQEFIKEL